jgi:hypothetical protein
VWVIKGEPSRRQKKIFGRPFCCKRGGVTTSKQKEREGGRVKKPANLSFSGLPPPT